MYISLPQIPIVAICYTAVNAAKIGSSILPEISVHLPKVNVSVTILRPHLVFHGIALVAKIG
ncbi:hypothetical protein CCP4SC76_2280019 [Gammaproteobacteria bacterium]